MLETRLSINLVNRSRPGARHPGEDQEFVENECVLGIGYRDGSSSDGRSSITELPEVVPSPTFDALTAE